MATKTFSTITKMTKLQSNQPIIVQHILRPEQRFDVDYVGKSIGRLNSVVYVYNHFSGDVITNCDEQKLLATPTGIND